MVILAVDPGLEHPAAAWGQPAHPYARPVDLMRAERVATRDEWSKLDILERSDRVAEAVFEWAASQLPRLPDVVIIEFPQWYGRGSKGDPNDLAGLAAIAGSLVGRLRMHPFDADPEVHGNPFKVLSPRPRQVWGQVPKTTRGNPWTSARGKRLADRLTPSEKPRVESTHDALDAAGLLLHAAGRWGVKRVLPGAA